MSSKDNISSRRSFLKKTALFTGGTATALTGFPAVSRAETAENPVIEWQCTSSFPKSLDVLFGAAEYVARRVKEMTNGAFRIQIYAPQELAPALEALNVVSNGSVQMCHTSSYYYVGKDKTFAVGTALPFGMNARQFQSWYMMGGGKEVLQDFYNNYDVHHLLCGNTGCQMGGWFLKPVSSLADLQGLKIRMSGIAGEIFQRIGAVPQQIAGSDVYPSLEKGTIDAAEWVGPYDDEKLGFHKIAKYYYYPGFWEGSASMNMFINKKAWDSLPKHYQAILEAATLEATSWMISIYDQKNPEAIRRLAGQHVQVMPYSDDILKAGLQASKDIYHEIASTNAHFKIVIDSYRKTLENLKLWHKFTENRYDNAMLYSENPFPK